MMSEEPASGLVISNLRDCLIRPATIIVSKVRLQTEARATAMMRELRTIMGEDVLGFLDVDQVTEEL
jgi:hypothetical protein